MELISNKVGLKRGTHAFGGNAVKHASHAFKETRNVATQNFVNLQLFKQIKPFYVFAFLFLLSVAPLEGKTSRTITYSILEKQPVRTFVGDVLVDSNVTTRVKDSSRLFFTIKNDSKLFNIGVKDGKLFTNQVLSREKLCPSRDPCHLTLVVVIKTSHSSHLTFPVVVNLIDINDHRPSFKEEKFFLSVPETAKVGSFYAIPSATDLDYGVNDIQEYRMSGETKNFKLSISNDDDAENKELRLELMHKLDRESKESYSIVVTAIDGGEPRLSGSMLVNVSVADANDNSPSFTQDVYYKEVSENIPVGTMILRVSASDPDAGANGQVTYSFSDQTSKSYGNIFWIESSTGQIFTKDKLDYETRKFYSLSVQAIDGGIGSLPKFAKVSINVTDINDNSPEIVVYEWSGTGTPGVNENAKSGQVVAQISVRDRDENGEQEVQCSIDNTKDFTLVPFEKNAYKLDTKRVFDREKTSSYKILITCKDSGSPVKEHSEEIEVKIIDENDNLPMLSSSNNFTFYVYENNKENDLITKINATDLDSGINSALHYTLKEIPKSTKKVLSIDPVLGKITANIVFNYEQQSYYKFKLTVTDGGKTPKSVTAILQLHILDVNDKKPKFEKSSYYLSVSEDNSIGSVIGCVNASDDDASEAFNRITYRIESSDDAFEIDENTGEIKNLKRLDREEQALYKFQVVASNPGLLKVETRVNVTVYVDDVNDNAPVFVVPQKDDDKLIQLPADSKPGTLVTRLVATDEDIGANAELVFTISNGNVDNSFSIDPTTGVITVAKSLKTSDNQDRLHKLVISVSDLGNPSLMTVADLNIMVNNSISLFSKDDASMALSNKLSEKHVLLLVVVVGVAAILIICFVLVVICVNKRRRRKRNERGKYLVTRVVDAYESESQGKPCRSPTYQQSNNHHSTSTMDCQKLGVGSSSITVDTSSIKSECNCNNRTSSIPPPPPPNIMSPLCRDEDDEDIEVCRLHEPNLAMMATSWDPNQNMRVTPVCCIASCFIACLISALMSFSINNVVHLKNIIIIFYKQPFLPYQSSTTSRTRILTACAATQPPAKLMAPLPTAAIVLLKRHTPATAAAQTATRPITNASTTKRPATTTSLPTTPPSLTNSPTNNTTSMPAIKGLSTLQSRSQYERFCTFPSFLCFSNDSKCLSISSSISPYLLCLNLMFLGALLHSCIPLIAFYLPAIGSGERLGI